MTKNSSIDFTQYVLDASVRVALELVSIQEVGVRDAGAIIKAIFRVYRENLSETLGPSFGFSSFYFIVHPPSLPPIPKYRPPDLSAVELSDGLRESFEVATRYLDGRLLEEDLVTILLLSNDPSLAYFLTSIGEDVSRIQTAWFQTLLAEPLRRSRAVWRKWWEEASERKRNSGTRSVSPRTHLLTWNSDQFTDPDFTSLAASILAGESPEVAWIAVLNTEIGLGDRVFLIKLGQGARGLVGSGLVSGNPIEGSTSALLLGDTPVYDWISEPPPGRVFTRVPVTWDTLSLDPILSIEELIERFGRRDFWQDPSGGREIDYALAESLEAAWAEVQGRTSGPVSDPVRLRSAVSMGDEPSRVDRLGRAGLVDALAAMLDHPHQGTPFTMALLGDWGAGKTTVMKLLQERLSPTDESTEAPSIPTRHDFVPVWFNAWEYEKTGNLAAGLAQESVRALIRGVGIWKRPWLQVRFAWNEHRWRFVLNLFGLILTLVLALALWQWADIETIQGEVVRGVFSLGLFAFGYKALKQFHELLSHPLADQFTSYFKLPDYEEHLGLIPVLHRHVATLCKLRGIQRSEDKTDRQAKQRPRRLLVFIDDLDRCGTRAIMDTFDAIRLVMVVPEVVVIVGIDARIAFRAVGSHYAKLADDGTTKEEIARDFLGKIIQLPIRLGPPPSLTPFIQDLFAGPASGNSPLESGAPLRDESEALSLANLLPGKDVQAGGGATAVGVTDEVPPEDWVGDFSPPSQPIEEATAAERLAILLELDRDMEHSPEEAEDFERLANLFGFTNPRRLLRLRNSYRLLRLLDLQRWSSSRGESVERERLDSWRIMVGLFWQEYLHGLKPDLRPLAEAWARSKRGAGSPLPESSRKVVEEFCDLDDERLCWAQDLAVNSAFIERLVLPQGEAPEVSPDAKDADRDDAQEDGPVQR